MISCGRIHTGCPVASVVIATRTCLCGLAQCIGKIPPLIHACVHEKVHRVTMRLICKVSFIMQSYAGCREYLKKM